MPLCAPCGSGPHTVTRRSDGLHALVPQRVCEQEGVPLIILASTHSTATHTFALSGKRPHAAEFREHGDARSTGAVSSQLKETDDVAVKRHEALDEDEIVFKSGSFIRKLDTRCLPCFALHRERASVAPHEMLRLVASEAKLTGTREEFVCATCGQTMVRFLAKQTTPPPSDVWRNEPASGAQSAPAAVAPPAADCSEEQALELDVEEEGFEQGATPALAYEDLQEEETSAPLSEMSASLIVPQPIVVHRSQTQG